MEREYQTIAINKTFDYLNTTTGDGLIVMPTGTGKSHVIAGVTKRMLQHRPDRRVQVLMHMKELINQNYEKLVDSWPGAPVGIYSAGLGIKQNYMPITMGGIMSVKSQAARFGHTDAVLVDEAHLVPHESDTVYRKYLNELREINPRMRVIGLTATDWRIGQGKLTDPGGLFTDTIINMTQLHVFNRFFEEGYLVRLVSRPMQTKLDVSGVSMSGGDLNMTEVQKAVDKQEITWQALQELVQYGQHRRKWLIFASGVDHADHISEMLNRMGYPTTVVHRGIPKKERDQRIIDYKTGNKYRAIVCNNILTTGFDDPGIDLIGVLRPSMSSGLWVQMLGRGTRPYYVKGFDLNTKEGRLLAIANSYKKDCLVLDFAHNTSNLGPINDPVMPKRASGKSGDPPIKICETKRLKYREQGAVGCGFYNHPSYKFCEECNAEFDFAVKFGSESSNVDLISDGTDAFEWFDIKLTTYSAQVGGSGIPYLRVDYWYTDKKKWTDYVNLQHTGYVQHQARQWWAARFKHPEWGHPPSVAEILRYCNKSYLREPKRIRVWTTKQPIPEVVNYEYE